MPLDEKTKKSLAARLANELISKLGLGPHPEIAIAALVAAASAIALGRKKHDDFYDCVELSLDVLEDEEKKQNYQPEENNGPTLH